jgi:hypothetical protein
MFSPPRLKLTPEQRLERLYLVRRLAMVLPLLTVLVGWMDKLKPYFFWVKYLSPRYWEAHLSVRIRELHESVVTRRSDGQIENEARKDLNALELMGATYAQAVQAVEMYAPKPDFLESFAQQEQDGPAESEPLQKEELQALVGSVAAELRAMLALEMEEPPAVEVEVKKAKKKPKAKKRSRK